MTERWSASVVLRTAETGIAIAATVFLVAAHVRLYRHAGALWRDEVNSVHLAALSSVADVWRSGEYDSFPMLWFLILRAWTSVGLGGTDISFRVLGLVVGLGLLTALWLTVRSFGMPVPLVSLVLFAASPTTLRVGDSLRAYGLGLMLLLFMLCAVWRVVKTPTPGWVAVAGISAVLAVQCLYYNAILLFAMAVGAAAVSCRRREWTTVLTLGGIGLTAAASLLLYVPAMSRLQAWNGLVKLPIDLPWIGLKFTHAIGTAGQFAVWMWIALFLLAVAACCRLILSPKQGVSDDSKDLAIFIGATMAVGLAGHIIFLKVLSYPTEPWYYVTLMALLAISIEVSLHAFARDSVAARAVRVGGVAVLAVLVWGPIWQTAGTRSTNVDLVAAHLEVEATNDDLIVVFPWWLGVTFARHYRGSAPWVTLPDIPDHRFHRYDLVKLRMLEPDAIRSTLARVATTLQSGRSVWLAGGLRFLPAGERPGSIPLPPRGPLGWNELPYSITWARQVAWLIQTRAGTVTRVEMPAVDPVSPYERMSLFTANGWR